MHLTLGHAGRAITLCLPLTVSALPIPPPLNGLSTAPPTNSHRIYPQLCCVYLRFLAVDNGATARLMRRGEAYNTISDPHPESFVPQYFPGFSQAKTGIVRQFRSPLFVRFPLNCHTINQSATCHSAVHCPTAVFSGHCHSL